SSNAGVVTVDNSGLLTFTGAGTATVTVTEAASGNYASQSTTFSVTVNKAAGNALVAPADITAQVNSLPVTVDVGGGNGGRRTFSSSNSAVASVNASTGQVSFLSQGTSVITVTEEPTGNYAAPSPVSFNVTVELDAGASLSVADVSATYGDVPVTLAVKGGNGGALSYASADPAVVSVDTAGLLTFNSVGNTTVTVTEAGSNKYYPQSKTVSVVVKPGSGTALVAPADVTVTLGDAPVTAVANGGNGGMLSYSSNDTGIVTADSNGLLTFLSPGVAIITVTEAASGNYESQSKTFKVTVIPSVGTALVPPGDVTATFGDAPVTAEATGGNGGALSYSSSDPSVVTVDNNGLLTFINAGSAYITVIERNSNSQLDQQVSY
ncbi:Ig-like domain-containing protein, partial [Aeromonas veronii]|uniref:Ig-like domain-containing protein n=1 Tax=Aeromonas veronii TaxID=654 RepID=UPI0040557E1D